MPLNAKVFRTRTLTALVFAAVMLTGLLWDGSSFLLLFSIIHAGCWMEYLRLMRLILPGKVSVSRIPLLSSVFAGWLAMLYCALPMLPWAGLLPGGGPILAAALVSLAAALAASLRQGGSVTGLAVTLGGLLYVSLPWILFIHLRSGSPWTTEVHDGAGVITPVLDARAAVGGYVLPLVVVATVWVNDTMAYIVGSLIGRTPLSPVSPKKTWEGTLGGILLSVLLVTAAGAFVLKGEAWQFAGVSLVAAVAGTYGDLFESKLKRLAGVKDSGSFMPGHGGFLDRFDSLLFAVPAVWIFTILLLV